MRKRRSSRPRQSAQASQSLEEVVVTASAIGVKKLDASYNIVTVDQDLIKESNPKSAADLLKLSPGIWPESSGGQTGANIEVAGFPSGGDSPFFTKMIEGMPLYGMPNLSFTDSTSLFRIDDTIERVEVVQGGPGAVFGPGQMGATANFILRTGIRRADRLGRRDVRQRGPVAHGYHRTASRSPTAGTAGSAASTVYPMACARRSSQPTRAASSPPP